MFALPETASARAHALVLIERWDDSRTVHMDTLVQEFRRTSRLDDRDRRFVEELCFGTVKARGTLRLLSQRTLDRGLEHYDRLLRTAIALGLYQHVFLRTPPHAVVSETVSAFREVMEVRRAQELHIKKSSGLLNAVLRRATHQIEHRGLDAPESEIATAVRIADGWAVLPELFGKSAAGPPLPLYQCLAFRYSHPPEMVRIWLERASETQVKEWMVWNNGTPPNYLVLRRDIDALALIKRWREAQWDVSDLQDDRVVELRTRRAVDELSGFASGDFWVQDINARRLGLLMPQRESARLLDLCAAPGGKLAGLLDRGPLTSVLACDVSEERLRLVAENLNRLRLDSSRIQCLVVPPDPDRLRLPGRYDQVLVDVPCSNTGVLARRHEARWRFLPEVLRPLHRLQRQLLAAGFRALDPAGHLLYTTCSIEPEENEEAVADFLRVERSARLLVEASYAPGELGGDGGYGALIEKKALTSSP